MSQLNLLHYRAWQGSLRRPLWSVWPILRVALASLLRRRLFWIMYGLTLFLFLMFFFGTFLLNWLETQLTGPIQFGSLRAEPDRVMQSIRRLLRALSGGQDTFRYFFNYQASAVVVMVVFTGSVLVEYGL